jgi:hypothetical protein
MAQSEKIIISVELRDKGVKSKSKKAKDSIDQLTDSSKKLAQAKKNLAIAESEEGRELAALQIKTQLAVKANRELALATMKTTKATKEGKTQTGLNNAILTEAGRAASDAQYGMQGMSNNLGQLATLMSQHAQTQGGFVASMQELKGSLMGVGGILIGIQLFISFLPMLEKWYKRVTNAADDFVESLTSQQALLKTVSNKLLDENTTLEERKSILESLKKDNKELYDLLVKDGKERGDTNGTIKKYLGLLKNEEIIRKKIEKINEQIKETSDDLKENNEDIKKAQDVINKSLQKEKDIREDTYFSESARNNDINKQQAKQLAWQRIISKEEEDNREIEERKVKLTEEVLDLEKENAKVRKDLGLGEEKKKPKATRDENIFLAKTLDFVNEIKNAKKVAASDDLLTERELLNSKQKLRREELKTELDLFLAKEKIRRDLFVADKDNTKAEKAKAEETYNNSVKNAQASYDVAIGFMNKAEKAEDNLLVRRIGEAGRSLEERQRIHDADIEAIRDKIKRMKGLIDSEGGEIKGLILPKTRENLESDVENIEKEMEIKNTQLENDKLTVEAKMQLEREYTDLDVELTEKRINIAQIEQDSKRKFLNDGVSLLNSASKLAKKGSAASKALAISSTTISTWDAAQQAYRSQMTATPDSPIRAQIAWASAVAKGMLNVKNIIAEKKPGGGSSGGGGGMPPVQPPDFNIIGSTGTNQLADAIGGTTQQPIKAYVVSGEVTSAQELDRNIVESASI